MRKRIVAGNWKMNTDIETGVQLAGDIDKMLKEKPVEGVGVVIATPFTHLSEVKKVIDSDRIVLAAQNCATEESGAYTGEVSAAMLKSIGAEAVIIGHSERREYYGETDEILLKKVNQVLKHELTPIFCCGEVLSEREAGKHFEVVKSQLENVVFQLSADDFKKIVIAYEPVWAIGTGVVATPEQAQEIQKFIRETIAAKFGAEVADETTIQYGGSCKPSNSEEIFANPDVDGGLIGGASLKAEDFYAIVNSF